MMGSLTEAGMEFSCRARDCRFAFAFRRRLLRQKQLQNKEQGKVQLHEGQEQQYVFKPTDHLEGIIPQRNSSSRLKGEPTEGLSQD